MKRADALSLVTTDNKDGKIINSVLTIVNNSGGVEGAFFVPPLGLSEPAILRNNGTFKAELHTPNLGS